MAGAAAVGTDSVEAMVDLSMLRACVLGASHLNDAELTQVLQEAGSVGSSRASENLVAQLVQMIRNQDLTDPVVVSDAAKAKAEAKGAHKVASESKPKAKGRAKKPSAYKAAMKQVKSSPPSVDVDAGGAPASELAVQVETIPQRAQLAKLKVAELKERLKKLGEPATGKKDDLVDRLLGVLEVAAAAAPAPSPAAASAPASARASSVCDLGSSDEEEQEEESGTKLPKVSGSVPASTSRADSTADATASSTGREPLILILDEQLQQLPWEGLPFLKPYPVSRTPSTAHVLWSNIRRREAVDGFGEGAEAEAEADAARVLTSGVRLDRTHYILDPEANLSRTQDALKPLFSRMESIFSWKGTVGTAPSEELFRCDA